MPASIFEKPTAALVNSETTLRSLKLSAQESKQINLCSLTKKLPFKGHKMTQEYRKQYFGYCFSLTRSLDYQ